MQSISPHCVDILRAGGIFWPSFPSLESVSIQSADSSDGEMDVERGMGC